MMLGNKEYNFGLMAKQLKSQNKGDVLQWMKLLRQFDPLLQSCTFHQTTHTSRLPAEMRSRFHSKGVKHFWFGLSFGVSSRRRRSPLSICMRRTRL